MKPLLLLLVLSLISQNNYEIIHDFQASKNLDNWYVVDDGVMGGLSQGKLTINQDGNGVYKGYVSTENNGGFSSVRYAFELKDVSRHTDVVLRIKGDGKDYQFRIKESRYQQFSYISTFETTGEWETIRIPFKDFYPGFRGYRLNRPNYPGDEMSEIAFLIGNKTNEDFTLEIKSIALD